MELLNKTAVKKFMHENKLKLGRDVLPVLERKVCEGLNMSVCRARNNRRKTLLGRDV